MNSRRMHPVSTARGVSWFPATITMAARGNPRDTHSYDMNRIYPGKPNGFLTERVSWAHDAKIGQLALENDFLERALTKAGLLSARK